MRTTYSLLARLKSTEYNLAHDSPLTFTTSGLLTKLLGRIYFQEYRPGASPGKLPIGQNAAVSALALVGTLWCVTPSVEVAIDFALA